MTCGARKTGSSGTRTGWEARPSPKKEPSVSPRLEPRPHTLSPCTRSGISDESKMFRAACKRLGLRQIFTRPYTPKTNGKAERFIQTALREWAYARAYHNSDQRSAELPYWLHRYNWHRPHGSLKANTPISRLGLSEDNCIRADWSSAAWRDARPESLCRPAHRSPPRRVRRRAWAPWMPATLPASAASVCTENSVRIDYVTESPNVSGDDRSVLPLPGVVRLAVQVEEPT